MIELACACCGAIVAARAPSSSRGALAFCVACVLHVDAAPLAPCSARRRCDVRDVPAQRRPRACPRCNPGDGVICEKHSAGARRA